MVGQPYKKIVLISDTATGETITLPSTGRETDKSNELEAYAEPNSSGGDSNSRNILNLNRIASQNKPRVSFTDEAILDLNSEGSIIDEGGVTFPSSDRSWLQTDIERNYAKEVARAELEKMYEAGNLLRIEIFDPRALTNDSKTLRGLRSSCSGAGSTCQWPTAGHPSYRQYDGFLKSIKFNERSKSTNTEYEVDMTFEIGQAQQ